MYKIRVFVVFFFFSHTADVPKHIKISTVWGRYNSYFRKQRHSDQVLTVNKGHLFGDWEWDPGIGVGEAAVPRERDYGDLTALQASLPFFGPQGPTLPFPPRGKDPRQ